LMENEEKIAVLKKANSWNQEMSCISELVRVRIVQRPEIGPISDEKLIDAYHDIFYGVELSRRRNALSNMVYLRTDAYGRSVYLGIGAGREWISTHIAVIFQPDHSLDLEKGTLTITDNYNYQTDLRLFMEANGWDTPFNP